MTRVKICGLRTEDEARHAATSGADLIGLNVWAGTPRHVTASQAASIARAVRSGPKPPAIVLVAVLPDEGDLGAIVREVRPDHVQVHGPWGGETHLEGVPVIRAFALGSPSDLAAIAAWTGDLALVDAKVEGMHGGTGRRIPPELLERIQRPYLLAGGLRPDNVAAAVRRFRPWAVDVASGVESSPGIKSPELVERFIAAVRSAD